MGFREGVKEFLGLKKREQTGGVNEPLLQPHNPMDITMRPIDAAAIKETAAQPAKPQEGTPSASEPPKAS